MRAVRARTAGLLLAGVLSGGEAQAATFAISPVSISMEAGQRSAELTVKNGGAEPMTVQVRVYSWTQAGDEDVLSPTSDIVLSPPVATIAAGGAQTLRLLLRAGVAADLVREHHYRILLDEIPVADSRAGVLNFAVRSSIPVFVMAKRTPVPTLHWRAARGVSGAVVVSAINPGGTYDRVLNVVVRSPDAVVLDTTLRGSNAYVLPHSQRQWVVSGAAAGAALHLSATTRQGKSDETLPIDP